MKILFVDDNKEFIDLAVNYLLKNKNINSIDYTYDGKEALKLLKDNSYDLVILDLVMPKYDGIYLLKEIQSKTKVIISTSYSCSNMLMNLNRYNINAILIKPYTLEYLEEKIMDINKDLNINYNIYDLLYKFGISRNLKGYKYIQDSLSYVYENNNIFIKDIYKKVSNINNSTPYNIERAIRNAIETGCKKGDITYYEKVFGYSIDYNKAKPTNKQFIFTVYEYLNHNYNNK